MPKGTKELIIHQETNCAKMYAISFLVQYFIAQNSTHNL